MKRKSAAPDNGVEITVMRIAGEWSRSLPGYGRAVGAWCAAALPPDKGHVTAVLADDATLRRLNRTFRGKDKPTNVLSFNGGGEALGEIVLAYETVKREAKEQGKGFARHAAHLVVHGCLHLLGHDHEDTREAEIMEALEQSILARLGFPDPYIIAV